MRLYIYSCVWNTFACNAKYIIIIVMIVIIIIVIIIISVVSDYCHSFEYFVLSPSVIFLTQWFFSVKKKIHCFENFFILVFSISLLFFLFFYFYFFHFYFFLFFYLSFFHFLFSLFYLLSTFLLFFLTFFLFFHQFFSPRKRIRK